MKQFKLIFPFLIFLVFFPSCSEKEYELDASELSVTQSSYVASRMTISTAKQIYYGDDGDSEVSLQFYNLNDITDSDCRGNIPYWYLSKEVGLTDGGSLLTVPVDIPVDANQAGTGAQLVFFEDSDCDQPYTFMWYSGTSPDVDGRPSNMSNEDFTGYVYAHNYCNNIIRVFELMDGQFLNYVDIEDDEYECYSDEITKKGLTEWSSLICGGPGDCPNFSKGGKKKGFFARILDGIEALLESITTGQGDPPTYTVWSQTVINRGGGGTEGGGGAGGGSTHPFIEDIFNDPIFNGEGLSAHQQLTSIIAENNYNICPSELHNILHSCLREHYGSTVDGSGAGLDDGPSDASDIDGLDFDMDNYLRLLRDDDLVSSCLNSGNISYIDSDLSENDVETLCAIKQFFPEEDVLEIFNIINDSCSDYLSCNYAQLYCLDRLRGFRERYGDIMSYTELHSIARGACNASDEEFDDEVFNLLAQTYLDQVNDNLEDELLDSSLSSFFDRTLSCESFNSFQSQSSGDGWIGLVDELYLSKNLGGAYSATNLFCVSFTVAKRRHNGVTISKGKAQDCAAWAANAAAMGTGFAFAENPLMEDAALIVLFRKMWGISMESSECGYGNAVDCRSVNGLSNSSGAVWNEGFFEWASEQLFGCGG